MYKQVFRYDNVLGYGIIQNKKWDEVLAALGMFCSNSKLCVFFASWRAEHEWESRMVDNVCFFSFTFTTNIKVLIDDWVLLANSWVPLMDGWVPLVDGWVPLVDGGCKSWFGCVFLQYFKYPAPLQQPPPPPSLPHKSESSVVGKTS